MTKTRSEKVIFDRSHLTIEQIVAIARGDASAQLNPDNAYREQIESGARFIDKLLEEEGVIYGVTTGYGDSCTVAIPTQLADELPKHLFTFHGCGLGQEFDLQQGRAIVASRLASLSKGYSGVSLVMLERLEWLLQQGIIPVIPEEGSVGASGDLTPLSYIAAVLCGERHVYHHGVKRSTRVVYTELGIEPITLRPKEGLAIMNGTAVMTALACLAYDRAQYLAQLCTRITAMASLVLEGNSHHFDEILFAVKPHPGQQQIAAWLRTDLNTDEPPRNPKRLQDRYSIRCAPHVIGVLQDALPWLRSYIENELNSTNDNPIIDAEGEHVLHGGHFYGGHIAFAMDSLKNCVANLADLMDRQMALMMDTKFNHGLPANLSGARGERGCINHGLKAVQIGTSSWTAEALKLTMPASVFSRSTECHNQDKVSMGTIAARDCLRVLQLTEQVASALLIAVRQGLQLRIDNGELAESALTSSIQQMQQQLTSQIEFINEDRPLEPTLRELITGIQQQQWSLY